jgi:hypothetical protein
MVSLSITVRELGNSTGSVMRVAISGSRKSSGASSYCIYKNKVRYSFNSTYLFLNSCIFHVLENKCKFLKLLLVHWINYNVLLGAVKDLDCLLEGLDAVRSSVSDHVLLEHLQVAHVRVHRHQVYQQRLWLKMESLRVLDLKL